MNEGQTLESKVTQSVCAQCGSRLSSTDGADQICINCLLRSALDQDDIDSGKTPRRPDQLTPGDNGAPIEFGDYELLQEIGRGSQGVVYRARQKSLDRIVALKVIALGHWATEPHVKRFRREAEAAARLNHPSIVPIYEVGERDGACYFSMGLVEGGQLDAMLEGEPMSIRSAVELIVKLARTVQYAHEHNILHRDIKPGNILLDEKGEPHLTDFGLARLVETESTVTRTREVLGTPSYMAPEQAAGETAKLGKATDVYGLGAVLYQLLTGHPPFAGGTTYETIRLLLNTEPRQPRLWNRKVDRELSTICLTCLEKDPKRRYPAAVGLAEDLEHWLKHEPIRAKRSGFFTHARKWVRRKPAIAALIASLVAFAATLGWVVWKSEFIPAPVTSGVAVLPFENLSGDPNNAYFANGIQEEILTRLASIADLRVISRTSTQQYQSKPTNLRQIAEQLGVANIVEGSVQKAADQVRVNVQLVNALTDSHLWADTYDRKVTDILGVESEIAKGIAGALQAKLTGREEQALAVKPTNNPEAYNAYLHGLAFETTRDNAYTLNDAIDFYQRAVQLDPNFAIAWARLSRVNAWFYGNYDGSAARRDAVKRALDNAQKLAPDLPETLLALGYYQNNVLRDYGLAKATFGRVSKMLPNSSEGLRGLGGVAIHEGKWDEGMADYEQALTLDPRDVQLLIRAAYTYSLLRQYPAALKLYDRVLDIMPNDRGAMAAKASIYQGQGNLQEAAKLIPEINTQTSDQYSFVIKSIQLRLERNYAEAIRLQQNRLAQFHFAFGIQKANSEFRLVLTQRVAGDIAGAKVSAAQARKTLESLCKSQPESPMLAALMSLTNAALGDKDSALKEYERADALSARAGDRLDVSMIRGPVLVLLQIMLGENSDAISTLTRLLQTSYGSRSLYLLYDQTPITPALLRLDPVWDPLRADPAFQKLCEQKQP
jgi:serine/threonine protein kinase